MTNVSSARHLQVIGHRCRFAASGGRNADPGHRGRSAHPVVPRPRAGSRGVHGRRRRRRTRGTRPGDGGALGPRRARPAPARVERAAGAARAATREARAAGGDPLRPRRRADEAPRLRARRHRLPRRSRSRSTSYSRGSASDCATQRLSATSTSCGAATVLDLARRQARFGERTADLSDREFRLLHHLLVHVGEVVSRERLLAEVWGYGFDPGSNVVDVCVRRLRKKLGPEAAIETVRNAGYRLVAA